MLKMFRESMRGKNANRFNKNLKETLKHSSGLIFKLTQAAAYIAICFIAVEMRNKKNHLNKSQRIFEITCYSSNEEADENLMDIFKRVALRIIKAVASMTAVAASIATCITVVEMREERNQLYKPQMIFESSHYSDDYEYDICGLHSVNSLICILYDEDNLPPLETTIYNIGSGAALEIEIEFLLENYNEYVEEIGYYFRDGTVVANDSGFAIHYDGKTLNHYANREGCIVGKPFLRPGESMDIAFPKEFSKLLYYLIRCTWGDYGAYPTVHLQISFSDLQGTKYCIDYKLGVKMVTDASEKGDKYFHVDYNIEQIYLTDEKNEDPGAYKEYYS